MKMIKQLEKAGLGFHVDAKKTTDRMGSLKIYQKHIICSQYVMI